MAGGTAVVTALGTTTGSALGGVVANAYIGEIKGFKIVPLKQGRGPSVLIVNGFLTQKKNQEREWLETLGRHYRGNPWYLVEWETKALYDLGKLVGGEMPTGLAGLAAVGKAAKAASRKALGPLALLDGAVLATRLAMNPWHVAWIKSTQTGSVLADIIARTSGRKQYVLMGHSLGAKVVFHCLQALGGHAKPRIKTAHLLGAAVGTGKAKDWQLAASAVSGKIHNYYSKNDDVLRILVKVGQAFRGSPAIGRNPIRSAPTNLENHDVTNQVAGHGEFKKASADFLDP